MKKQQFKHPWPGLMILLFVCFQTSISNAQIAPGTYTIKTKLIANKNLDVPGANKAQGTRIHLWSTNNGEAQKFTITPSNEAGYYHIKTEWGLCLGVGGSNPNPGAGIVTWACINNLDDQKWKFTNTGDGYYNIQSKLGTYIDVKNANTNDGAEIVMNGYSTWNGNIAERWKLERITSSSAKIIPRNTWFTPIRTAFLTSIIRINNFTPNKHQYNSTGERAFLRPNDSYFRVTMDGRPFSLPFDIDMVEGGPDNRCKAYINDWNSNNVIVVTNNGKLQIRLFFESNGVELMTDCYNNGCCEGNPFCPGAGCPDFELNNAWIEMQLHPLLLGGNLTYVSNVDFKVDVRELWPDPCTNNFWAFLCDMGVVPRVGDRENRIRSAIEVNIKSQLDNPLIKTAIQSALKKSVQSAGINLSDYRSVEIAANGDLVLFK